MCKLSTILTPTHMHMHMHMQSSILACAVLRAALFLCRHHAWSGSVPHFCHQVVPHQELRLKRVWCQQRHLRPEPVSLPSMCVQKGTLVWLLIAAAVVLPLLGDPVLGVLLVALCIRTNTCLRFCCLDVCMHNMLHLMQCVLRCCCFTVLSCRP